METHADPGLGTERLPSKQSMVAETVVLLIAIAISAAQLIGATGSERLAWGAVLLGALLSSIAVVSAWFQRRVYINTLVNLLADGGKSHGDSGSAESSAAPRWSLPRNEILRDLSDLGAGSAARDIKADTL